MKITIEKTASAGAKNNIVLLATGKTKFDGFGFSKEELGYLRKQLEELEGQTGNPSSRSELMHLI